MLQGHFIQLLLTNQQSECYLVNIVDFATIKDGSVHNHKAYVKNTGIQKWTDVTLTSSKYGTKSRGLMNSDMLRVLTHALADDWPPTATVSEPIMCDGGILTRPRLIAPVRTSLSFGSTWSVRMCGRMSDRMSRSSTSLRSRFFTPLRLILCAVWLSRFGSMWHITITTIILRTGSHRQQCPVQHYVFFELIIHNKNATEIKPAINEHYHRVWRRRKYDDVTPLLRELHWLRVPERIIFRLATLTYRCLHNMAPHYLAVQLNRASSVTSRRWLRSASTSELIVPRTSRSTVGDRAFCVTAAWAWNTLTPSVQSSESLPIFRRRLKTELFLRSFPD